LEAEIAYAIVPKISGLPEPLQTEVRKAFASSLQTLWRVLVAISGAGILCSCLIREIKMPQIVDDQWGMKDEGANEDEEKRDG